MSFNSTSSAEVGSSTQYSPQHPRGNPPKLVTFLAFAMSAAKPACIFLGMTIFSASAGTDPSPAPSADCPNDAEADTEADADRIPPAPDRTACFSLSFSLYGGSGEGGGQETARAVGEKRRTGKEGRIGSNGREQPEATLADFF